MITTVYQKFISKYAETFTLIEMTDGKDYISSEIIPSNKVAALSDEEYDDLFNALFDSENEKACWTDDDNDNVFNEEDARAAHHQKWDEINSTFDKIGI